MQRRSTSYHYLSDFLRKVINKHRLYSCLSLIYSFRVCFSQPSQMRKKSKYPTFYDFNIGQFSLCCCFIGNNVQLSTHGWNGTEKNGCQWRNCVCKCDDVQWCWNVSGGLSSSLKNCFPYQLFSDVAQHEARRYGSSPGVWVANCLQQNFCFPLFSFSTTLLKLKIDNEKEIEVGCG